MPALPAACSVSPALLWSSRGAPAPTCGPVGLSLACRQPFALSRAKANWRRMTNMQARFKKVVDYAQDIVSWKSPMQSLVAITLGIVLSYYPHIIVSLALGSLAGVHGPRCRLAAGAGRVWLHRRLTAGPASEPLPGVPQGCCGRGGAGLAALTASAAS